MFGLRLVLFAGLWFRALLLFLWSVCSWGVMLCIGVVRFVLLLLRMLASHVFLRIRPGMVSCFGLWFVFLIGSCIGGR